VVIQYGIGNLVAAVMKRLELLFARGYCASQRLQVRVYVIGQI
jgi:hypothetical protein